MIHHIDSADDPRVVAFRDVRQHSVGVSSSPWIVAEGHRVVRRSCASRYAVQKILATEHCVDQYAQHAGHGIEVYAAPKRLISEIVGYDFHRSVLAVVHRPAMVGLSEFRQRLQIDQPPPVILAAVEVTEQENLGSMIRTAAAMGICDVLCVGTLDPLSRRVLRVSMGAALAINLFQIPQVDHFGEWLRQRNFDRVRCLAATPAGNSIPIADYVKKSQSDAESSPAGRPVPSTGDAFGPCGPPPGMGTSILLIGNESRGLPQDLISACDVAVRVPMAGQRCDQTIDSYNASIAAAILLDHLCQR